jgi:hypothetical protein
MTNNELIKSAETELKKGDLLDIIKARDILLDNGFINNKDSVLQKKFFDLFPPSKELENELAGSLKQLFDKDEAVRKKASIYIEKQPRKSMNGYLKLWLKDPRTIDILCKAIDDKNLDVQENVILALGTIADRYDYVDLEVYKKIIRKYDTANDKLKVSIAQSVGKYPTNEKWNVILNAFDIKPTKRTRKYTR